MDLEDTWKQFNIFGGIDILSADGRILIRDYDGKKLQEDTEDESVINPDNKEH